MANPLEILFITGMVLYTPEGVGVGKLNSYHDLSTCEAMQKEYVRTNPGADKDTCLPLQRRKIEIISKMLHKHILTREDFKVPVSTDTVTAAALARTIKRMKRR